MAPSEVMKGLILSAIVFVLYVVSCAALSHILRPKRHSGLFLLTLCCWTPVYFAVFLFSPDNLWFLSAPWTCSIRWLDALYGYGVFLLNCHSFIDFFFGVNGGFSTCIILEIGRAGRDGLSAEALMDMFRGKDETDKVYGWRLPRLVQTGYIHQDDSSGTYGLTRKGRIAATVALAGKTLLNLDKGG